MEKTQGKEMDNIRYFYVISTDCDRKQNFRWNSETFEIMAYMPNRREGCLTAIKDGQPTLKNCTQEKNQKWIFGPPKIRIKRKVEDSQPLLLQLHLYMERQVTTHENMLEK